MKILKIMRNDIIFAVGIIILAIMAISLFTSFIMLLATAGGEYSSWYFISRGLTILFFIYLWYIEAKSRS